MTENTPQTNPGNTPHKSGRATVIVIGAVIIVALLSLLDWNSITGSVFKNFNILGDIIPTGESAATGQEVIDPELQKALATLDAGQDGTTNTKATQPVKDKDGKTVEADMNPATPKQAVENVVNGEVIIEDYTPDGRGLASLKAAIANRSNRPARIAVIGDSYIEGDILTQHLRQFLQDTYGGSGVGYMYLQSGLTGFRQTVRQTNSGWTAHDIRKTKDAEFKTLQGEYFTAGSGAKTTYKGTSYLPHLDAWDMTRVLAVAPGGGTVTVTTDNANQSLELTAGNEVQCLTLPGRTTAATVTATPGVEVLGAYLDSSTGILVDNMSLRGNSGISHAGISIDRAAAMRPYVDYDLIIVEYGINALSSQQKDYSGYKKLMKKAVNRIRNCYPNADILVMGIGDRGQKSGSQVTSLPTSPNMVGAQRDLARETGVLFWDTRKAMGGEGAVLTWRQNGYINPDYIHLNAKGGKQLAQLLVDAIRKTL